MILNEYLGNLQRVSPKVFRAINFRNSVTQNHISPNSKVEVVNLEKLQKICEANIESIALIITRIGQRDISVIRLQHNSEDIYNSQYAISFNYFENDSNSKLPSIGYGSSLKNYLDRLEFFTKNDPKIKLNFQIVYRDPNLGDLRNYRTTNIADDEEKISRKDYKNGYHNNASVHGNIIKKDKDYYKKNLTQRLTKYIDSKLPSYEGLEDIQEGFKAIQKNLRGFKIEGEIFKNNENIAKEKMNGENPVTFLSKNGFFYLGYTNQKEKIDTDELYAILFKVVIDINGKMEVKDVKGALYSKYISDLYYQPLEWIFSNAKDDKDDDKDYLKNKLGLNTDEDEDW